jgi:hypothetical protein
MFIAYSNRNDLSVFEHHRSPAGKQMGRRKNNDTLPAFNSRKPQYDECLSNQVVGELAAL